MSKFLCVTFDRYVTEDSKEQYIEGDSFYTVVREYMSDGGENPLEDDTITWINDEYKQVSDTFGCIPGEETDHLFYKID